MKKLAIIIILLTFTANVNAQWYGKKIKGNGNVVTKTRNVSYDEYSKPSFGDSCWSEYKYLFQDGEWQVFDVEMKEEATA